MYKDKELFFQNAFFDQAANCYGLHCSGCGEPNLHHYQTEIFNRADEDSETGNHVLVTDQTTVSDANMSGNPSRRRDGVAIHMWCEHCDIETTLEISQHKGSTYLELTSKPLFRNRLKELLGGK